MSWYNTGWKQRQPVAIDASAFGSGAYQSKDVEFQVPPDWDLFWDNIRSDFLDVVPVDVAGNKLGFTRKAGASYADRSLYIQLPALTLKTLAVDQVYLYFQNPDQTVDLSKVSTISSPLIGYIDLARPSGLMVVQPLQRPPTSEPQTAFVKATTDQIDIFFAIGGLFTVRASPYNARLSNEDVEYVNIQSLDSSGTNDTNRYLEDKTRFIDGFVRVRAVGGSDGTDYALVCRVVSNFEQQIDLRCLIQVRDQLPT